MNLHLVAKSRSDLIPSEMCRRRRDGLSKALSGEGAAVLPPHNVFAIRNYHKGSSSQDPGESKHDLTTASLLFESLI